MKFDDAKFALTAAIQGGGYNAKKFLVVPDLGTDPNGEKRFPGATVWAQIGDGLGLQSESLYDAPFLRLRVAGDQNDYADAERLALLIDRYLLTFDGPALFGTAWVLYFTRTGGPPSMQSQDAAGRYHFMCNYVFETPTGI